jgi:prepilin-type N-terminal cleavage/methylation domain-containing protein
MKPVATRHQPPATQQVQSAVSVFQFFSFSAFQSPVCTNPTSGSPLVTRHSFAQGLSRRASALVTRRRPAAFTLVELLVVIAIIITLAGLGFAGLQGAMESSRKAQARNDVAQVAAAVKSYQLEYGRLPESGNVIAQLTGDNSKKIVFFEAKAARGNPPKGGISGKKLLDPWGEAYTVRLDDDYDNKMQHGGATHFTTVIVETTPPGQNAKPINNVQ